jgi:protein dithiol oxidoreductase (disulfide-forming)
VTLGARNKVKTRIASLLLIATLLAPLPVLAQMRWVDGQHYHTLTPAAPTSVPAGKIEVTEIFSYGCPYCFQASAQIEKLKAGLPADAVMTYVPASFIPSEGWPMFQRAYLTAKALGIADSTHELMYAAVWQSGEMPLMDKTTGRVSKTLPTIEDAALFYSRHSRVKQDEFLAMARSPQIDAAMKNADALVEAYKVPGTPALVVNGRYLLEMSAVGSYTAALQLIDYLISQERVRLKLPAASVR